MTQPFPVSPASELARRGVQIRAGRIGGGLGLLTGLYTLLALVTLGGQAALWAFSGSFWEELGADRALPAWTFGLGFVFTALFYLPYLLTLLAARRAVLSLRDFALAPRRPAPELPGDLKRFISWLGVWQWGTLASVVLGLGLVAAALGLSRALLPDGAASSLGGPESALCC